LHSYFLGLAQFFLPDGLLSYVANLSEKGSQLIAIFKFCIFV